MDWDNDFCKRAAELFPHYFTFTITAPKQIEDAINLVKKRFGADSMPFTDSTPDLALGVWTFYKVDSFKYVFFFRNENDAIETKLMVG